MAEVKIFVSRLSNDNAANELCALELFEVFSPHVRHGFRMLFRNAKAVNYLRRNFI